MRPSLLVIGGWLAATVAVTGVAVAGVQIVSSRVVEPLPPIAAVSPSISPSSGTTGSEASGPPFVIEPTTSPNPDPGPTTSPLPNKGTPPPPTSSPSPTSTPTSSPSPTSSPTSSPTPAESELRSYSVVGGSVTLRFSPGNVQVVSVSPNPGFTVDIEGDGTAEVSVKLESETHESRVKGWWEPGHGPRDEIREDTED